MVRVDSATCPQAPHGALESALPLNKGLRVSSSFSAKSASPREIPMGILDTLWHFRWMYMLKCHQKSLPPKSFSSHSYRKSLGQALQSRSPTQLPAGCHHWHLGCHFQRKETHRPHLVLAHSSAWHGQPHATDTQPGFPQSLHSLFLSILDLFVCLKIL